ncbi:helix-turn-helix domain-containing protein [Rhodoferax sp.]|uniref:helix-turn-helix domain-containing protein n=1 Tax=Rhodoferax sp. TaxID=50421 RepID=UPI002761587F|nr:helix-turn-helix domain-containing protein [Rhodoferax sp.]
MQPPASPLPNAQPMARLTRIEQARQAVIQEHRSPPSGAVAPWIERSWQRCVALGLQPDQRVGFDVLSSEQMRRTAEANAALVQTARPVLDRLGRAIVNTRYFAILTNAQGVVVDVSGAIDRADRRADLITRVGVDLSERSVGTTAIGAVLNELRPVWLHRGEHFFADTSVYSCAGAPVFGPDGLCAGMLDLTGIDAVERPELKHLVTQSASKIENALVLAQPHVLTVRLNWPGNHMGSDADGLLCLDTDGWITGANRTARDMVPNLGGANRDGVHISEVFGIAHEALFDAVRRSDPRLEIPLWTGLRLQALPIARACESEPLTVERRQPATERLPLKDMEAALIRKAVSDAKGNVMQAARALGISRATVYRKLGQKKAD